MLNGRRLIATCTRGGTDDGPRREHLLRQLTIFERVRRGGGQRGEVGDYRTLVSVGMSFVVTPAQLNEMVTMQLNRN